MKIYLWDAPARMPCYPLHLRIEAHDFDFRLGIGQLRIAAFEAQENFRRIQRHQKRDHQVIFPVKFRGRDERLRVLAEWNERFDLRR